MKFVLGIGLVFGPFRYTDDRKTKLLIGLKIQDGIYGIIGILLRFFLKKNFS